MNMFEPTGVINFAHAIALYILKQDGWKLTGQRVANMVSNIEKVLAKHPRLEIVVVSHQIGQI